MSKVSISQGKYTRHRCDASHSWGVAQWRGFMVCETWQRTSVKCLTSTYLRPLRSEQTSEWTSIYVCIVSGVQITCDVLLLQEISIYLHAVVQCIYPTQLPLNQEVTGLNLTCAIFQLRVNFTSGSQQGYLHSTYNSTHYICKMCVNLAFATACQNTLIHTL